ncbi:TNT domain-containing protein [Vibrio sp. ZSDE26]|uniref:TNT domain-containing protein n=2 Tax=Vibrio TaxID=662 RepID=A0A9X2BJZ7_9VIBR|nr:glycohydrolase toxin TNT-related protein [Vibrio amylolyticus]MCK6265715.1 TNT domain-containing protein [Vibrio amylolyticus]
MTEHRDNLDTRLDDYIYTPSEKDKNNHTQVIDDVYAKAKSQDWKQDDPKKPEGNLAHTFYPMDELYLHGIPGTFEKLVGLKKGDELSRFVTKRQEPDWNYEINLDEGKYVAPNDGTPYDQRALPGDENQQVEIRFRVIKDFEDPIIKSKITAWFNTTGDTGIQLNTRKISEMEDNGWIEVIE